MERIATLEAEKAQAKSIFNANAIKARTLREKTAQKIGLKIPSGYTIDAQMRAVQQQQQQHVEKGR